MRLIRTAFALATLTAASAVRADPAPTTKPDSPGTDVVITLDTSEAPDLAPWANDKLVPVLKEWYPKIVAELAIPGGYKAPAHFSIKFDPTNKGVAWTQGTHIDANPAWFRTQLHGEAIGALLHEAVHVVQNPWHAPHAHHMPGWLLEGSCDYIRWFQYEPKHPHPRASQAKYDASYRTTAAFLNWVVQKYDKNIVAQVNTASYNGAYSDDLWVKYTGKSVADLGAEWKASLAPATRPAPVTP